MNVRGGNGGAGGDGTPSGGKGGVAGGVTDVKISGVQLDLTITGGKGGDALLKGAGGAGGVVTDIFSLSFKQTDFPDAPPQPEVTATLPAGAGGKGAGGSAGGKGGIVDTASITVGRGQEFFQQGIRKSVVDGGPIAVTAGLGGDSAGGKGGAGGSIIDSNFASFGGM
jgi:hypothetical protein